MLMRLFGLNYAVTQLYTHFLSLYSLQRYIAFFVLDTLFLNIAHFPSCMYYDF